MDELRDTQYNLPIGTDCISRQAAIDAYGDWYVEEGTAEGFIGTVKQLLEGLPPAEPKRGRWVSADAIFGGVPFYCSECGENTRDTVMGKPRWKFCPMCGAKMEVEHE